jgi:hypothetical protein
MPSIARLNAFQCGIFQKFFSLAVYVICFFAITHIANWLETRRFTNTAKKALRDGVITQDNFSKFLEVIASADSTDIYLVLTLAAILSCIAWFIIRFTGKLNWTFVTILPKAVEFRAAMTELGVPEPFEQVDFVRKHELPVFIARTPFHAGEKEKTEIEAHLYVFGRNPAMSARDIFERNIGRRTLCLDIDDYENIRQKVRTPPTANEFVLLTEKSKELESITAESSRQKVEIARLMKENSTLQTQFNTMKAREGKGYKALRDAFPLWQVVVPMIVSMKAEGKLGQYTRPVIQDAFKQEMERHPELQNDVRGVLGNSDDALPKWFVEVVRLELGNLASKGGRSPKA